MCIAPIAAHVTLDVENLSFITLYTIPPSLKQALEYSFTLHHRIRSQLLNSMCSKHPIPTFDWFYLFRSKYPLLLIRATL